MPQVPLESIGRVTLESLRQRDSSCIRPYGASKGNMLLNAECNGPGLSARTSGTHHRQTQSIVMTSKKQREIQIQTEIIVMQDRPDSVAKPLPYTETAVELRKARIRSIYQDVLSKAGQSAARALYATYFGDDPHAIDVNGLEHEYEEKKKLDLQSRSNIATRADLRPRGSKADSVLEPVKPLRNITSCPTPAEKQQRAKNYGRWYLQPTAFASLLNHRRIQP
jgi:hypothetical protein